jgi:hypothetical protein
MQSKLALYSTIFHSKSILLIQTKIASKLIVWNVIFQIYAFENWSLAYPAHSWQTAIFLRSIWSIIDEL